MKFVSAQSEMFGAIRSLSKIGNQSAFLSVLTETSKTDTVQTTLSYRNKAFMSGIAKFDHPGIEEQ
jgi:hypothetical protein